MKYIFISTCVFGQINATMFSILNQLWHRNALVSAFWMVNIQIYIHFMVHSKRLNFGYRPPNSHSLVCSWLRIADIHHHGGLLSLVEAAIDSVSNGTTEPIAWPSLPRSAGRRSSRVTSGHCPCQTGPPLCGHQPAVCPALPRNGAPQPIDATLQQHRPGRLHPTGRLQHLHDLHCRSRLFFTATLLPCLRQSNPVDLCGHFRVRTDFECQPTAGSSDAALLQRRTAKFDLHQPGSGHGELIRTDSGHAANLSNCFVCFQFETVTQSLLQTRCGFTLINATTIRSSTFFVVSNESIFLNILFFGTSLPPQG